MLDTNAINTMAFNSSLANALTNNGQDYAVKCLESLELLKASCEKELKRQEDYIEKLKKIQAQRIEERTKGLEEEYSEEYISDIINEEIELFNDGALFIEEENLDELREHLETVKRIIAVYEVYKRNEF